MISFSTNQDSFSFSTKTVCTFCAIALSLFMVSVVGIAQPTIRWQKSMGTENSDVSVSLFKDREDNLLIIGLEPHQDFTGNFRDYMVFTKLDPDGNEIWKTYHDVAFETFNPPVDYSIGNHFFTEEFGEKLINLVVSINNRTLLVKFLETNGMFYTYEDVSAPVIDILPNNDKVYAVTLCSSQLACYGPDSLIVQQFDPTPDSIIFNPIKWTYETRQNIRTAPIQGHYDFDPQDIKEDSLGNVYLLIQIERWDFQFCTDCGDAFVDAWCEVFKFSPEGELLKHKRLVTSKAVVSAMGFVSFDEGKMIVRVDDINASNTPLVSTVYFVDEELNVTSHFGLGRQHVFIRSDGANNLYTCTNNYDLNNPDIHGLSDVLVSKFNAEGNLLWQHNFGGSGWEWPRGFVVTNTHGVVFLANSESSDFDVETNLGGQDMWVVNLTEEVTGVEPIQTASQITLYPNPVGDVLEIVNGSAEGEYSLYDLYGHLLKTIHAQNEIEIVNVTDLPAGHYVIRAAGKGSIGKFTKE